MLNTKYSVEFKIYFKKRPNCRMVNFGLASQNEVYGYHTKKDAVGRYNLFLREIEDIEGVKITHHEPNNGKKLKSLQAVTPNGDTYFVLLTTRVCIY